MHRSRVLVRWRFALMLLTLCVALLPAAFAVGASADARFDVTNPEGRIIDSVTTENTRR